MRIAIIATPFLPKWIGGTELATHNLARLLGLRGHEVHVITSLDAGLPAHSRHDGYHVHRVALRQIRMIGYLLFCLKSVVVMIEIKPDIVHIQAISSGIPALLMKFMLRVPYVVWGQGGDVYLDWPFKRVVLRSVIRNACSAIALTEDMKQEMRMYCDRSIVVIPNGVDVERFSNIPSSKTSRKKSSDVILIGSLKEMKGVRYLLQAMRIVCDKRPQSRLILVGDGVSKSDLQTLTKSLGLENNVEFVGQIPNENVVDYLGNAKLMVVPSLAEGLPLVILEGLAAGLPIVASNVGGIPSVVTDGQNGFLVEAENPFEIAEKTLLILDDRDLRTRISDNNRKKARSYDWTCITSLIEEVYEECTRLT